MKKIVIYHGRCNDGFTAAWVASRRFNDNTVEFHEGIFGQPPPEVKGKACYLLDFSYSKEEMQKMSNDAEFFICIDHHQTAYEKLEGLNTLFDLAHSGARLAWDWFNPYRPRPRIIDYVEDMDMWWRRLPHTNEITAILRSYTHNFAIWDQLAYDIELAEGFEKLVLEGRAILRYINRQIYVAVERATPVDILGHEVFITNSTTSFSEVAAELAEDKPFGVCYFRREDGLFQYSLRSNEEGIDVSEIAKQFGGGGHKHSAGFQLPYILGM